jgi:hypothetical protein
MPGHRTLFTQTSATYSELLDGSEPDIDSSFGFDLPFPLPTYGSTFVNPSLQS